jgi:hypothetical protein
MPIICQVQIALVPGAMLDPKRVATGLGITYERAAQALEQLRDASQTGQAGAGAAARPAVVEQAVRAITDNLLGSGDGYRPSSPELTIEECVTKLREQADDWTAQASGFGGERRLADFAKRLRDVSDELLARANYMALTEAGGRLREQLSNLLIRLDHELFGQLGETRFRDGAGNLKHGRFRPGPAERCVQPYTQDILEAIADVLGTEPAMLLSCRPEDSDTLFSVWDRIPKSGRRQALSVPCASSSGTDKSGKTPVKGEENRSNLRAASEAPEWAGCETGEV